MLAARHSSLQPPQALDCRSELGGDIFPLALPPDIIASASLHPFHP